MIQKVGAKNRGKNTVSDRFLEPRIFEKPFLVMKCTDSESKEAFSIRIQWESKATSHQKVAGI